MTREEWREFERVKQAPDVQLAMRARCKEQSHDFENCCSMTMRLYQACKWCGERQ